MCGETRIPRDMCAGNTLPGETYITVTPGQQLWPTQEIKKNTPDDLSAGQWYPWRPSSESRAAELVS